MEQLSWRMPTNSKLRRKLMIPKRYVHISPGPCQVHVCDHLHLEPDLQRTCELPGLVCQPVLEFSISLGRGRGFAGTAGRNSLIGDSGLLLKHIQPLMKALLAKPGMQATDPFDPCGNAHFSGDMLPEPANSRPAHMKHRKTRSHSQINFFKSPSVSESSIVPCSLARGSVRPSKANHHSTTCKLNPLQASATVCKLYRQRFPACWTEQKAPKCAEILKFAEITLIATVMRP